ncbi:MAG: segregation/condensation protein A [Acidimicrobiia bacterium]|nr:segregation/condensation protein A [Acidimicrobiia bacterium]MBT8214649.1 segregation/condensation protein A [Acidimicrobiia bacterium]NNF68755.1 segregation/condensation protein A [Acidimicrobiia bacterium]NNK91154.1 segregation/condensation protein A [Acidimicrobiia bacterium]
MSYHVKTRVFEGPVDLLLQLITSHQLTITELSLSDLVTEYVAYLDEMRALDLEVTSEFLLIASTLIQLKARFLLPDGRDVDLDEELALAEERDRLLARLLACLTFKDVAAVLAHRFATNRDYVPRMVGLDSDIVPPPPQLSLTITPERFGRLAHGVINRSLEPDLDHLDLELPSVDDAIVDLRARVNAEVLTDFDELVSHCERPVEVVAYFLALLELVRWGVVRLSQDDRRQPIVVTGTGERPVDGMTLSEWSQ